MKYTFDGGDLGRCTMELKTSGNFGFGRQKVIAISSGGEGVERTSYYTFANDQVHAPGVAEFTNLTIGRIVIEQFLSENLAKHVAAKRMIDTRTQPFDGAINNSRGGLLSRYSFARVNRLSNSSKRFPTEPV